jgi:hypothetical protein
MAAPSVLGQAHELDPWVLGGQGSLVRAIYTSVVDHHDQTHEVGHPGERAPNQTSLIVCRDDHRNGRSKRALGRASEKRVSALGCASEKRRSVHSTVTVFARLRG